MNTETISIIALTVMAIAGISLQFYKPYQKLSERLTIVSIVDFCNDILADDQIVELVEGQVLAGKAVSLTALQTALNSTPNGKLIHQSLMDYGPEDVLYASSEELDQADILVYVFKWHSIHFYI